MPKITELTANAAPALEDLTPQVDDPSGTPVTKKVTNTATMELFRANQHAFFQTAEQTVANTVTETTLTAAAGNGSLTLPANFLTAGRYIRLKAQGRISNTGTPTINIRFKLGSTTIVLTGVVTTLTGLANAFWEVEVTLRCVSTGISGSVIAQGKFSYDGGTNGAIEGMVATAAVTIDTTVTQAVDLTATWGTASVSNTITATTLALERLN